MKVLDVIKRDLYRYSGSRSYIRNIIKFISTRPLHIIVLYRCIKFFDRNKLYYPIRVFLLIIYRFFETLYGISLPVKCKIGHGLYIGHFGGVIINQEVVIGNNCNISHNVTIGKSNSAQSSGVPTIGDNVYIAPGAVISGGISIGNECLIGPNAVVLSSTEEGAVVLPQPAFQVSTAGSKKYINRVYGIEKL